MIKLRIRMELNRGKGGVPLRELARVVDEAQKFFNMLGDDVHIDRTAGEWLASDFDNEFLNFTAEFSRPVELHQVDQFRAAFDGTTQLRRGTIAQFARIGIALGENETIAFGLFRNDEDLEPDEWRSLSKHDAARINSEISELLTQTGENGADSPPVAVDTHAVTNLFVGPREQNLLAGRVAHLENEIARQAEALERIRVTTAHTDQGLQGLMRTVDVFCERTTRHLAELPAPATPERSNKLGWRIPAILAVMCTVVAWWWLFSGNTNRARPSDGGVRAAEPAVVSPPPANPAPPPTPPAPTRPRSAARRIDLKAIEPDWITVSVDGKEVTSQLLNPLESITLEQPGTVRIRSGNAGGAEILLDGKSIGPIGRKGQVATIEFTGNDFHVFPR